MTHKTPLSDILGRRRARPRFLLEFKETDADGLAYTLEVEVRAHAPTMALRVAHACVALFGEPLAKLLATGEVDIQGFRVTAEDATGDLAATFASALAQLAKTTEAADLSALAVRLLAGACRWRVARPESDGPSQWHEVEDDDDAAEVLDDLFPTVQHLASACLVAIRLNVRPT